MDGAAFLFVYIETGLKRSVLGKFTVWNRQKDALPLQIKTKVANMKSIYYLLCGIQTKQRR